MNISGDATLVAGTGIGQVLMRTTNDENRTAEIAEIAESPIISLRSPRPLRLFFEGTTHEPNGLATN